jgi:hypothetical protein
MATISATTNEKIYPIKRWLGLNQSIDGDTKLKMGEASVMQNWRVTRDGNLRRRPGTELVSSIGSGPVRRLWSGTVAGVECVLAACDGKLYRIFNGETWSKTSLGSVNTTGDVFIFGFDGKAYVMDGVSYKVYDGSTLKAVEGYRPLVVTAAVPGGGGTSLEQLNKLNGLRRVQYSPDGAALTYFLPEQNIASVDYAKNLVTGAAITGYSVDKAAGTVTFTSAPAKGINTVEIGYSVSTNFRSTVEKMRYAELYNGTQDSRVFLYGDGSNEVFYSGLDTDGNGRADYFPDMNEAQIGESNTPVTALIRHSGRLMAFKPNGAYSIVYGSVTLADGSVIATFNVTPVNKSIGNMAMGQAQLVLNYPRTLCGDDLYEWRGSSTYVTADERLAKRISDRVQASLRSFNFENCKCWDDNDAQEYYICEGTTALVNNYASDAWYVYTNWDAQTMCNFRGELYMGTSDGRVLRVSDSIRTDCGNAIPALWESGSMDFNADYMRKYTSMLWVSVKPESNSHVEITVKTDRKSDFPVKVVAKNVSSFGGMDFSAFSFITSKRPYITRLRIKAKKYAYYKLIFQSAEPDTTATVLGVDIRVRQTGYAK